MNNTPPFHFMDWCFTTPVNRPNKKVRINDTIPTTTAVSTPNVFGAGTNVTNNFASLLSHSLLDYAETLATDPLFAPADCK
jgi:hypothetical protein